MHTDNLSVRILLARFWISSAKNRGSLALFEAELRSQGIKNNIAVHIVGDFNEAAIRLFKSSGYMAFAVMMEKRLTPLT